jgi:hypothetical protein
MATIPIIKGVEDVHDIIDESMTQGCTDNTYVIFDFGDNKVDMVVKNGKVIKKDDSYEDIDFLCEFTSLYCD